MTAKERELIRQGLARVHKGRLIPRIKGGATYTPKTLVAAKALGNAAANITTWQYQNTGTLGTVCRELVFSGQAGATGAVTVEIGVTGATAVTAQRIIDAYVLTANVPQSFPGWKNVDVNYFLGGYADSGTVNGAAYGVTAA